MRTIVVSNHKGGCGKTTTAVNLAAAYAMRGYKVLMIDFDSQGHATLGLVVNPYELDLTVFDALTREDILLTDVIINTKFPQLDVVPSNMVLSGGELELASWQNREYILKDNLNKINDAYDYVFVDCSPSLSILTLNALVAGDGLIIPIQAHYYALEGLKQVMKTIKIVKERFNPRLHILGLVITLMEKRALLCKEVESQMRSFFGDYVFKTVIHKTIRLAEASGKGEPIFSYEPNCSGAKEYMALVDEIIYGKEKIWTTQGNLVNL